MSNSEDEILLAEHSNVNSQNFGDHAHRQNSQSRRNTHENITISTSTKSIIFYILGFLILIRSSIFLVTLEENKDDLDELFRFLQSNLVDVNSLPGQTDNPPYNAPEFNKNLPYYLNGKLKIRTKAYDPTFKIEKSCTKLVRTVEMYQWQESSSTHTDEEGNTSTDYTYHKTWSTRRINSESFHSFFYTNPSMDYSSQQFFSNFVAVENENLIKRPYPTYPLINLKPVFIDQITWKSESNKQDSDHQYKYFDRNLQPSQNTWSPALGDYRVYFTCYGSENDEISALGTIATGDLENSDFSDDYIFEEFLYQSNLPDVAILFENKVSPNLILQKVMRKTYYVDWLNRFLLFFMSFAGFIQLAEIIQFLFRKIPNIGPSMASGILVITGLISFGYTCMIISWAALDTRPVFSILGLIFVSLPWIGIYYKSYQVKLVKLTRPNLGRMKSE